MLEPQEGMSVEDIVGFASYAEKSGYGYLFRSDHLLPTSGKILEGGSPECWVSLGAVAAETTNLKFGPMVSPVGFRNPALLGRMACTLDSYSKGRICLGLGAGWNEEEYMAHGYEFPPFSVRRTQLEESLEIIRPMTEGRRVDFDGVYFSAHVECFPKPTRGKVHLIGGGRNPKVVQTLSKFVDEWNIYGSPLSKFQELKQILSQANREIEISQMGSFVIANTARELNMKIQEFSGRRGLDVRSENAQSLSSKGVIAGERSEFADQINKRIEAGIQKFYFQLLNPEDKAMIDNLTDTLRSI